MHGCNNDISSNWSKFLEMNENSYDIVVCNNVLFHTATRGQPGMQGIYDCFKLLKQNGGIVIQM